MKNEMKLIKTLLCDQHQKGMKFDHREKQNHAIKAEAGKYGNGYMNQYISFAYDHYKCPLGCSITIVHRLISESDEHWWKTKIKELNELPFSKTLGYEIKTERYEICFICGKTKPEFKFITNTCVCVECFNKPENKDKIFLKSNAK